MVVGSIALENLKLEIQAQECKRSIFLPAGGGEVGTGHQERLVYQNKSRIQLKGKVEREGKRLENVVFGWKEMEQNEQENRKTGEALKEITEHSRKSARRDVLCVRDWSGLEKVKSQGSNKGNVRFVSRKESKSINIEDFEKGKFVIVVGSGSGGKC